MSPLFLDRTDAGRRLAEALADFAGRDDVVVLALPRGGVAVGYEVARALDAPLDVLPVRRLGLPDDPETAMGAIAPGGVRVLSLQVLSAARLEPEAVEAATARERAELERREALYRAGARPAEVLEKTVIVVDDGLATGASMTAAVAALRERGAGRVVAAVPVGDAGACGAVARRADEVVCLATPEPFDNVGRWYVYFGSISDGEVVRALARAAHAREPAAV